MLSINMKARNYTIQDPRNHHLDPYFFKYQRGNAYTPLCESSVNHTTFLISDFMMRVGQEQQLSLLVKGTRTFSHH